MAVKARKTWAEKLAGSKGLPKVIPIDARMSKRWGGGTCVIPAPRAVDALMRRVPAGRVTTVNEIREALAKKHGATICCPITTGIFAWIAAHAADEAERAGEADITPFWRTLKSGGELNVKYPGAGLHSLRHCFRCTPQVLHAAMTLILNNAAPDRIQKNLVSLYATADPPNQGSVHRWRFQTATQEADALAESCKSLVAAGLKSKDILILLATRNPQSGLWNVLRDALDQAGVPYEPPKEEGFADTSAGRLILALIRIICSRDDDGHPEDLVAHRLVLGLRHGVGVGTCLLIVLVIAARSVPQWHAPSAEQVSKVPLAPTATPLGMGLLGARVDSPGGSGYLLVFEIISVHLLVVLIGAAYLARAKRRRGAVA